MLEYFDTAITNAFRQIFGGFGLVFLFAFLMWVVSRKRRSIGSGAWGKTYQYLVAPGVMFHELGHAVGCILTGTKVKEFAPFKIEGERLGYVRYVQSGRFQALREFIIATGPVWLGCLVLFLFGMCLDGFDFLPAYSEAFPKEAGEPNFFVYLSGVAASAFQMLVSLLTNWNWTSPTYLLMLYLIFCVTSEITLSSTDLAGMWRGFVVIVFFILLINLIPGVHFLSLKLTELLAPVLFLVHVVLLFVLFIDIALFIIFRTVLSIFWPLHRRRRGRGYTDSHDR